MKILAFIIARKNSKGIINKNLNKISGKPLIQYTFESAIASKVFDDIYLSTDDKNIIELAKSFPHIQIPFVRPKNLSEDNSSVIDVINHLILFLEEKKNSFTHFVLLQPTCPFRYIKEIKDGVELLKKGNESVIGVSNAVHHPADYLTLDLDGKINFMMPDHISQPRQTFPEVYFNNGGFYGCELNFFKTNQIFFNRRSKILLMSDFSLIDIDSPFDLLLAKSISKKFKKNRNEKI